MILIMFCSVISLAESYGGCPRQRGNILSVNFTECKTSSGYPGFICNGKCKWIGLWCNSDSDSFYKQSACPDILPCGTMANSLLCDNSKEWRNITCDSGFSEDGPGVRCTGNNAGQCIYPDTIYSWYVRSCRDKSDQSHYHGVQCSAFHNVTRAQDTCGESCNNGNYRTTLGNSRFTTLEKCVSCLDPHDCYGSCGNFSTDTLETCRSECTGTEGGRCQRCLSKAVTNCTSCTNSSYFQCGTSGQCLHPALHCDGHPQCDQGEDEKGCGQEYREKNMFDKDAIYECPSPHHPGKVTILAIQCDGVPECFGNVDEENCSCD